MPPQPGSSVQLFIQRESAVSQPGMYFMFSEIPTDAWDEFNLLRFYFHIDAEGIAPLIAHLTTQLNRYLAPFRMKTLNDSRAYDRADAAVLYLAKRYYHLVSRILLDLPSQVSRSPCRLDSAVHGASGAGRRSGRGAEYRRKFRDEPLPVVGGRSRRRAFTRNSERLRPPDRDRERDSQ